MKNYRMKEEHPDHFVIHDTKDKSEFKVAKAHLDLPTMVKLSKIQRFSDGGDVSTSTDTGQTSSNITIPTIPTVAEVPADQSAVQAPAPTSQNPIPAEIADNGPKSAVASSSDPVLKTSDKPPANPASPNAPMDWEQANQQYNKDVLGSLSAQQGANTAIGAAQAQAAQTQAGIEADKAKDMKLANDHYQTNYNANMTENNNMRNDVANFKLDPNHFWASQSTGSKIGMLAGMIVSGFGAGAGQGNMAMNIINKSIDNDIEAQKTALGQKESLLSNNMAKFGVITLANTATRLNLLSASQGKIDAAAATANTVLAKQQALQLNAKIDAQKAELTHQLSLQQAGYNMLKTPSQQGAAPQSDGFDRNKLMGLNLSGILPPEDAKEIDKERGDYEKLKGDADIIKRQMAIIANERQVSQGGGWTPESRERVDDAKNIIANVVARDRFGKPTPELRDSIMGLADVGITHPGLMAEKTDNMLDLLKSNYPFTKSKQWGLLNPDTDRNLMGPKKAAEMLAAAEQKKKIASPPSSAPIGAVARNR